MAFFQVLTYGSEVKKDSNSTSGNLSEGKKSEDQK